ncbi:MULTISPECIES: acetyltransferase [Listeria]|uniref:acetyltransferase n=1 Tax=Listeria TaxID=1637 RepID=UPI000B5896A6|nr:MULTISPECIES: acetyltransferase [Listeria]
MKNIIIIGDGGHSKLVQHLVKELNHYQLTEIWDDKFQTDICIDNIYYRPLTPYLDKKRADASFFIAIGENAAREKIARALAKNQNTFASLIHPTAIVESPDQIGVGSLIMARAIVQLNAHVGNHVIVNSGAIIEHDTKLADFSHIGPGSVLTGGCKVGQGTLVGANSTFIPLITVGEKATIGAGSVVTKNIPARLVAAGVPAKIISNK